MRLPHYEQKRLEEIEGLNLVKCPKCYNFRKVKKNVIMSICYNCQEVMK